MRYDIEPNATLTGGAWYSESEFETEYVETLLKIGLDFIRGRVRVS